MREDQAEDPVLLLPGGTGAGAGDRDRGDQKRAVDGAHLAAVPAGDGAVVGAAQQLRDAGGNAELADRVAHRREQRPDGELHHRVGRALESDGHRRPVGSRGGDSGQRGELARIDGSAELDLQPLDGDRAQILQRVDDHQLSLAQDR